MKYIDIVNKALRELDSATVTSTQFITPYNTLHIRVKDWVNRVLRDIYSRSSDWSWAQHSTVLTTVPGQNWLGLPVDCNPDTLKVMVVGDGFNNFNPYWGLEYVDYEIWLTQFNPTVPSGSTTTNTTSGTPIRYTIHEGKVFLYPIPSEAIELFVTFQRIPTDLQVENDEPLVPDMWCHVVVDGVAMRLAQSLSDPISETFRTQYEVGLRRMLSTNRAQSERTVYTRMDPLYENQDL